MILVSACLAGVHCKYNGLHNLKPEIKALVEQGKAVLACPEELGGLSTPRISAEIVGGTGEDVLMGKAKVMNQIGEDVTDEFVTGAQKSLEIAKANGVTKAILKANSPSCGCGSIYDGTFTGHKQLGDGVTVALFKRAGIQIFTEEEWVRKKHER